MKKFLFILAALVTSLQLSTAHAADEIALIGNQGYDLVSYFNDGPVRGSGNHSATHKGVTYIFANKANKERFQANPEKYLPAYGGYCAYGVRAGRKVIVDPLSWKIVDGKLYLNLNENVQKIWQKDISGNIKLANENWKRLKDKPF